MAAPLYGELEAALDPRAEGDAHTLSDRFIARMGALCDEAGVQRRLRDVGVSHNDLPRLAEDAMLQTRLLGNNPRPVTQADAQALYEEAW